ncbi:MAG: aminoacetone oxidase family FAD-binding enzyme [Bacteroidales bacterium]|jgi:predicted Rossmann fold flavoprotein|nr:aminoacetone oxidase family FAD-binding enzyme [Bacteroidales bacterium]MCI1786213.1 aminoacetone oxidase family FAD-binding enzyme [Bacteroidales bacterium]
MNIAIIGGGAAGFFMAITVKKNMPDVSVTIFEKSRRVLAKVGISGGGRCNLSNSFEDVRDLKSVYPRGNILMKRLMNRFDQKDAYEWFESNGVPLTTQDDNCVFPESQDSHSVIDCFLRLSGKLGINVRTAHELKDIAKVTDKSSGNVLYELIFREGCKEAILFDKVGITAGGQPRIGTMEYLQNLGHKIEIPVPSLFAFNVNDPVLRSLTGATVDEASVTLASTNFRASGPLLVTHRGFSGPAILKLSSYAARYLKEKGYECTLIVNWTGGKDNNTVAGELLSIASLNPQKQLGSVCPFCLTSRLWNYLVSKAGLPVDKKWAELGKKGINKLSNILTDDEYGVAGRGHYRDEFVTCGGVSLESVDYNTLESKTCPGIYFAGEILDVDGITGGFNFQAAWTTAMVAALSMCGK